MIGMNQGSGVKASLFLPEKGGRADRQPRYLAGIFEQQAANKVYENRHIELSHVCTQHSGATCAKTARIITKRAEICDWKGLTCYKGIVTLLVYFLIEKLKSETKLEKISKQVQSCLLYYSVVFLPIS